MCAALVFVISLVVVFWASTSQAQKRVKTAMLFAPAVDAICVRNFSCPLAVLTVKVVAEYRE
jgi:hypothetical protein